MTFGEREFWDIISLVDQSALKAGEEGGAVEPLVAALRSRSVEDIFAFEETLAKVLYALDGRRFAEQAGESGGSDDGFLYARCFVVGRGEEEYRAALADPTRMPKSIDEWLESLLIVASSAFEQKTGLEWEHAASVNYETCSNASQW